MTEWLSQLHQYYLDSDPFVIATITAYHGSSPDQPGVCLLYSTNRIWRCVSSDDRYSSIRDSAKALLDNPTTHLVEKLPLGDIAGNKNGFCEVVFEHVESSCYPGWLTELRHHQSSGTSCVWEREFSKANRQVTSRVITMAEVSSDCYSVETDNSLVLSRVVQATTMAVTVIGKHPIATEIEKQCNHLPVSLTRLTDPIDFSQTLSDPFVVIMTADHELDYQCCLWALQQSPTQVRFVGCIGSEKKADLFKSRLTTEGIAEATLKRLHIPVGLPQIKGKQRTIVAASIIAQILSQG